MTESTRTEERKRGLFGQTVFGRRMIKPTILAFTCIAAPSLAMDDLQAMQLASSLGSLIGSEAFCGLTYDQDAISNYVAENVPPERMDFAQLLQMSTMGATYSQADMSPSAKTAHCASIRQTAKHFHFIK